MRRTEKNKKTENTRSGFDTPTSAALEKELARELYRQRYFRILRNTIYTLLIVAAIAVLIATLWTPVFKIYGNSMSPTVHDSDIVLSWKTSKYETGDVIAFYFNNKILVKRVIAGPGDWVDIDDEGTVTVNGEILKEPYVKQKDFGNTDIKLPYQVPESKIFVMGDNRKVSIDSRNTQVGCVPRDKIIGHLVMKLWPLSHAGGIK